MRGVKEAVHASSHAKLYVSAFTGESQWHCRTEIFTKNFKLHGGRGEGKGGGDGV
jgi:hypothetical protein